MSQAQQSTLPDMPMTEDEARVWACVRACMTQPGIPMPIQRVVAATAHRQKGRIQWTVGTVELFNGEIGTVRVSTWGRLESWSMQWLDPTPSFEWNGREWRTCSPIDREGGTPQ